MSDVRKLGKEVDIKHVKPRRLSYTKTVHPVDRTVEAQIEKGQTLLSNAGKLEKKADRLLEQMIQIAKLRNIPVHKEAREVRAAVRRKRTYTKGEYIELDLYMEALDYLEKEMDALDEDTFVNIPRDPASAGHYIKVTKTVKTEGIPWKDALYMASQAFILVIFKLLQKGTDNLDTQLQTSGKQFSGSETSAVLIALAISILMKLTVTDLLEDEIAEDAADQPSHTPIDMDDVSKVMGQAEATLEAMRAYRLAKIYKNPDDYRVIRDYVVGFLAETEKPGWEEWMLVPEVKDIQLDANSIKELLGVKIPPPDTKAPDYTGPDNILDSATDFLTGPHSPIKLKIGQSGAFPVTNELRTPDSVLSVFDSQLNSLNTGLNKAATVLSWRETQDSICCIVRLLGGFNTESLQTIREVLSSTMNTTSLDLDIVASGVINQSWGLGRRAATRLLWEIVDGYNKAVDRLWSYVTDSEGADTLAACTPLDEIFQYIAGWAKSYLDKAVTFVLKYVDVMGTKKTALDTKLSAVGNMKKIRGFLSIIDSVITAVDMGELCQPDGADSPSIEDVAVASERAVSGLPDTIVLASGPIDDPFSVFSTDEPMVLPNGITLSAVTVKDATGKLPKIDQEQCRKQLSGQDLKQLDAYLRRINGA